MSTGDRDRLYGLPLGEFTAERDRLARELRSGGDREAADAVRALRKPSLPAWALNQLARRSPDAVEALLAAGDKARSAQEEVLAGGERDRLTAAVQAEREAVGSLVEEARAILEAEDRKPSAQVMERVRDTLHAASTDEQVGDRLRSGRLVEHAESVGFGTASAAASALPRRPKRGKLDAAAARKRKQGLTTARRELRDAERRAERAVKRLDAAQAELDSARSEAESAEAELERSREALARLEKDSG